VQVKGWLEPHFTCFLFTCHVVSSDSCSVAIFRGSVTLWTDSGGWVVLQVKTARPCIRPNEGFVRQLKELQRQLGL
jgi:hypothetical protein